MAQLHHHIHNRREPYPARSWSLRLLDRTIYVAGVVGPLMTIPQLIKIYAFHDAAGVSLLTWGAYALLDLPWILYGVAHKLRPITLTYVLWFTFNSLVCLGVLLYGSSSLL